MFQLPGDNVATKTAELTSAVTTTTAEPASAVVTTTVEPTSVVTTTTAEPAASTITTTTAVSVSDAGNISNRMNDEQESSPNRGDDDAMDPDEQPHPLVINLDDPFDKNLLESSQAYTGLAYAPTSNKIFAMTEARADGTQAYKHVLLIPPSEEVEQSWLQKLKMYPKFKAHFVLIAKQRRNIFERVAYQLPTSTKIETKWQCIDPRAEISAEELTLLPRNCAVGTLVITRATASRIARSVIAAGDAASVHRAANQLNQQSAVADKSQAVNSSTTAMQEDSQSGRNPLSTSTADTHRVDTDSPIETLAKTASGIFEFEREEEDDAPASAATLTTTRPTGESRKRSHALSAGSGGSYGVGAKLPMLSSATLAALDVPRSAQFPASSAAQQPASTTTSSMRPRGFSSSLGPVTQRQPSTTTLVDASSLLQSPTSLAQASALRLSLEPSSSTTLATKTVPSGLTGQLDGFTAPEPRLTKSQKRKKPESEEASTTSAQMQSTAATIVTTAQAQTSATTSDTRSLSTFSRVTQQLSGPDRSNTSTTPMRSDLRASTDAANHPGQSFASAAATPPSSRSSSGQVTQTSSSAAMLNEVLTQLSIFADDELPEKTKQLIELAKAGDAQIKQAKQEMATQAKSALQALIAQQQQTLAAAQQKRARLEATLQSPAAQGSAPPPPPARGSTPEPRGQ